MILDPSDKYPKSGVFILVFPIITINTARLVKIRGTVKVLVIRMNMLPKCFACTIVMVHRIIHLCSRTNLIQVLVARIGILLFEANNSKVKCLIVYIDTIKRYGRYCITVITCIGSAIAFRFYKFHYFVTALAIDGKAS